MRLKAILILSLVTVLGFGLISAQAESPKPGPPGPPPGIDRPFPGHGPGFGMGPDMGPGMGPGMRGPGHRGAMFRGLIEKLGLTKEQKKKMRSLLANFLDSTRSARMAKRSLKDEKRAMIISGKIDFKKLAAIDEELVTNRAEVMKGWLKMRRARLELLTQEQRDILAEMMSHRPLHKGPPPPFHKGPHGKGPGGGPPQP